MYKIIKRTIDIAVALIVLILLFPLLIPIMIGLRLTGEGYVFYYQKRVGYKNRFFDIWKFATMLKNSPNIGTGSITLRNDPRITPMGGFLRKTKINELPQVINVLKGDMSLVGPRPQMKVDFDVYPQYVKDKIYDSVPGITSIGSIIFRDEEKYLSDTDMDPKQYYKEVIAPYKGEVELWYQKKASIINDLIILFLTVWVVVFPHSNLPYVIFKDMPKSDFIVDAIAK